MAKTNSLILLIFISHLAAENIFAQTSEKIFIGVQPNITVEPFYAEGELDISIFPLVAEIVIAKRTSLKLTPIINYHIGGEAQGISDVALFTVVPIYFGRVENWENALYGFYLGPVIGFGRNLLNKHYTSTLAVEPGYMFRAKKSFTLSLGMQLGGSFFSYDTQPNKWVSHWGPKVSLGFWL